MRWKVISRATCECGARSWSEWCTCLACGKPAPHVEFQVKWLGRPLRITHAQRGQRLISLKQAVAAQEDIAREMREGVFSPVAWRPTSPLLWEHYLDAYLVREKSRCTKATYDKKRAQVAHLKEAFQGMNIRDLRTAHIQDWAATLTMADKSQADLLGELRFILRQAEWREDIKVAPHVPTVKVAQKPIDWLLPEEQHAAFEKIPKVHQPIFATLFFYGMRPGEVCAAMWDQVNLSAHTFTISRTVSRRRIVERTKTSRPNVLPLTGPLAEYCAQVRGFPKTPIFKNPEATSESGCYTEDFLNSLWKAVRPREIKLYNAARHSKGMQALNLDGWTVDELQRLFGHTSPQHTRKYAEMGVARLEKRLGSQKVTNPKDKPNK